MLAAINAKCQINNTIIFPMGTLFRFGITGIIKISKQIIKPVVYKLGEETW